MIQIGLKVDEFVHVPITVDMHNFIQIHARFLSNLANRQTDKHRGQSHIPPLLWEVKNYTAATPLLWKILNAILLTSTILDVAETEMCKYFRFYVLY